MYAVQQEPAEPQIYFNGAIESMTAERGGASSISEATVITENNDQPVSVTVNDNFELSLDQQSWATSLVLDATGETFYVRLADTSEEDSYEGTITATTGVVTAYADVEGEVTAPTILIGDINQDGTVNIADVTVLISLVLKGNTAPWNPIADINQDGQITIADVTILISIVLKGGNNAMRWKALPSQGGISIDNPKGEMLEVYDLDANLVTSTTATGIIALQRGIYIVCSDTRSCKVVVK